MKTALLFASLLLSQSVFATQINCGNSAYDTTQLSDFGLLPEDITADQATTITGSVCDFYGVYQESWSATCFLNSDLQNLKAGDSIQGFYLEGFEHGALYTTKTDTLSCNVQ